MLSNSDSDVAYKKAIATVVCYSQTTKIKITSRLSPLIIPTSPGTDLSLASGCCSQDSGGISLTMSKLL